MSASPPPVPCRSPRWAAPPKRRNLLLVSWRPPPSLLALVLGLGTAMPVAAQNQTAINVPANAGWKHAGSGVILRSKIAGAVRGKIVDSSASELDVMVQYDEGGATPVTLYIFRPSLMSVPMWFDRSETQILLRSDVYGAVKPATAIRAFAAPHAGAPSALQRIYVPGKTEFKSTALAVIPLGEWLVVVRVSSSELGPVELDVGLSEIIAGIGWPEKIPDSPAAVPVAACTDVLPYAKKAKGPEARHDSGVDRRSNIRGGRRQGSQRKGSGAGGETHAAALVPRRHARRRIWRLSREGERNAYVLAAGDAGITTSVGPAMPLGDDPGYTLSLGMLDRNLVFPNFDKLPSPATAFDAINTLRPVSSVTHGSKDMTIGM